jgi:HEAT repeat protein
MWWGRNREYLVKMRSLLRRSTATTGIRKGEPRDPMKGKRDAILKTLRRLARSAKHRSLRAAAVMALGRMGGDEDALFFLRVLQENKEATGVVEAAAVALGILPPFEAATREKVRVFLRKMIEEPQHLPTRARGLTLLAAGLRARHDADLVMALQARGVGRKLKADETSNLVYALGLSGHPLVVPEVIFAVRDGTFAGRRLTDLPRAHAVQALALLEAPRRVQLLTTVLRSRRAYLQTKRSAAMALARLLRESDPPPHERRAAQRALLRTLKDTHDITLRGYAALAMGGARPPYGITTLKSMAESEPEIRLRPYCLLALGLAAREADSVEGRSIRRFLTVRLAKTGESEQVASTSIALGLARAHEATDLLLKRLRRNGIVPVRGAAAQGLGLMESRSAHVVRTLLTLADEERKKGRLLEDIALALGFSGRRDVALKLVDMLRQSTSSIVSGRIIIALGHLDHGGTVEPLHRILRDPGAPTPVREFASVALAFMGDRREKDVLFELDAYFNLYATTTATHELMRLY